jgi:hypothetical protein
MANLNKFLEITSLTENVNYPDGYNVLEVLGTGDERPASFSEPEGPGGAPIQYSNRQLSLEPADSDIPWLGSTTITVVGREEDGTGGTGSVSLSVVYGVGDLLPELVTLGTTSITNEICSISGFDSLSTKYPISSVSDIEFMGNHYTVQEIVDGSTIIIDGSFGVTTGDCLVDYVAAGIGTCTYDASTIEYNSTNFIIGRWSDAAPATITISISETGTNAGTSSISVSVEESSLPYEGSTGVIVEVDETISNGSTIFLETSAGTVDPSAIVGDKGFINAAGSITGRSTFSLPYRPKSYQHVDSILSRQVSYRAIAVEGTTVIIDGEFPFVTGDVTCSYTATGIAEAVFTAPAETTTCIIQATYTGAIPAACTVEVTAADGPGGYNWVTRPVFPTITISGPLTISSNGVDVAILTVTVYDPNSENPFLIQKNAFESCSVSGPQDFSTEYWITTINAAWEDETKTKPIPLTALTFRNNEVHISDDWTSPDAPAGWKGLYRPEVYIEYDGYTTLDVEDGLQVSDRWWERPGDDENRTETDVSGLIFVDELATIENTTSQVPIPSATGQTTTVKFYYRPDAGEEGVAYMNAAYKGSSVMWPISVICGSFVGASINMTAEPSTIAPGEKSLLTFTASDSNGGALYGDVDNPVTVHFFIQKGKGSITPASADLTRQTGLVEEVESSSTTEFSVSNPIVKITGISVIGGGFTWNGQATISGTSVTLVDQTFPLSTCPLSITYDWGGSAKVFYTANGDQDKDVVYVGGRIDSRANTLCKIDISADAAGGDSSLDLSISAENSSIASNASTSVTATAYKNGVAVRDGVAFSVVPQKGSLNMSYNTNTITDESCSISDRKTTSTSYIPSSVTSVKFLSVSYDIESVEGDTITLKGDGFPVASGTCEVTYVPTGLWKGTYNAGGGDYVAHLNMVVEKNMRTATVTVGTPDPTDPPPTDPGDPTTGPDLTVSAEPTDINRGEMSVVKAEIKLDGRPVSGGKVLFVAASGPGAMQEPFANADSNGVCESIYETQATGPIGTGKINVTWGEITKTVDISVKAEAEAVPKIEDLPEIVITGTIDPATKEVQLPANVILRSLGAGEDADQFGCIDQDPERMGPDALIHLNYQNYYDTGWIITDVVVVGAVCLVGTDTAGKYAYNDLDLYMPWLYGPNVARDQLVHVVDKLDETQPVVGATVSLGGQTAITDQNGTAKFTAVPPGDYQIGITHPNFKDNRAGVAGGTGV